MCVDPQEQRAVDAFRLAVFADRLGDREDMLFVETAVERTTAVAGSAERHTLRRVGWIRLDVEISGDQLVDIDKLRSLRGFTR